KTARTERPSRRSRASSASAQPQPRRSASSRATVVLPLPRGPIRKIRLATRQLLLRADGHRREGALDDPADQLDGGPAAGELLELQGGLADEQLDPGDDVAAAGAGLLDQQRLLGGV